MAVVIKHKKNVLLVAKIIYSRLSARAKRLLAPEGKQQVLGKLEHPASPDRCIRSLDRSDTGYL